MIINQIIAMFLPSIIALMIDNNFGIKSQSLSIQLQKYFIYVLFVNLLSFIVTAFILKETDVVFTYLFAIKYIGISLIFSIILPLAVIIISNNITCKLKVKKNETKNEKNN